MSIITDPYLVSAGAFDGDDKTSGVSWADTWLCSLINQVTLVLNYRANVLGEELYSMDYNLGGWHISIYNDEDRVAAFKRKPETDETG